MTKKQYGKLYGIGVGPGDPELITLKGLNALNRVPVIFAPKKSEKNKSLALSIISKFISQEKQKIIELVFPMVDDSHQLQKSWEDAADKVFNYLAEGTDCAFITEGDSMFYSTFIYLFKIFKAKYPDIEIIIIPGITAMSACADNAQIPLTESKETIAVLPATNPIKKIQNALAHFDTIVIMKLSDNLTDILKMVAKHESSFYPVYVKKCGTAEELIIRDIMLMEKTEPSYFSLLILKKFANSTFEQNHSI